MNLIQYSGFIAITVFAIVIIARAVFFVAIKADPIKAIVPKWPKIRKQIEQEISEAS